TTRHVGRGLGGLLVLGSFADETALIRSTASPHEGRSHSLPSAVPKRSPRTSFLAGWVTTWPLTRTAPLRTRCLAWPPLSASPATLTAWARVIESPCSGNGVIAVCYPIRVAATRSASAAERVGVPTVGLTPRRSPTAPRFACGPPWGCPPTRPPPLPCLP